MVSHRTDDMLAFLRSRWGWAYALLATVPGLAVGGRLTGGSPIAIYWGGLAALSIAAWILVCRWLSGHGVPVGRAMVRMAIAGAPLLLVFLGDVSCVFYRITVAGWMSLTSVALAATAVLLVSSGLFRAPDWLGDRVGAVLTWRLLPAALAAIWVIAYTGLSGAEWWWMEPRQCQDLAVHEQALHNTLEGRPLEYTCDFRGMGQPRHRFGDHFEPTLLLLLPLYALFRTPLVLLFVQALVLGSGAVALARIGRRVLAVPEAGPVFALVWLLHPGVISAVMAEYHNGVMAAPLVFWGIAFRLAGRPWWAAIAFLLALGCKESIGGTVCAVGLWLWWKGYRRFGPGVAAFSALWVLACVHLIIPHFSPTGAYQYALPDLWSTGEGLGHRWRAALYCRVDYLLMLIAPAGLACVFAPTALAISLPQFALHLLSGYPSMGVIIGHYHVEVLIGVMVGSVYGARRLAVALAGRPSGWATSSRVEARRLALLALFTVAAGLWAQCGYGSRSMEILARGRKESEQLRELMSRIPADSPVITQTPAAAAHLARRRWLAISSAEATLPDTWYNDLPEVHILAKDSVWTDASVRPIAQRLRTRIGVAGEYALWRVGPPRAPTR